MSTKLFAGIKNTSVMVFGLNEIIPEAEKRTRDEVRFCIKSADYFQSIFYLIIYVKYGQLN